MAHAASLHLRSSLFPGPPRHLRHGLAVWTLTALALALLLSLGACGKLPRPFEQGDKQANPLLLPPEGGELLVQRPTGVVPGLDDGGAALLAEGLTRGGVEASAVDRTAIGADLKVHVARSLVSPSKERLLISWEVLSPSGVARGEARQDLIAPIGAWAAGDPRVLIAVAEDAAPKLAPLVSGPDPTAQEVPLSPSGQPVPSLVVGLIEGAPGDGDRRLGEALVLLLAQQGIEVLREPSPDELLVEGRIALDPPQGGQQRIALTWIVRDGLDGPVLGEVTQENKIPSGSLDGAWGETAVFAATGAVEGIRDVLRRKNRL